MKITRIKTIYFSPCGSTKSVAEFMGNTIAKQLKVPNEIISYTLPEERQELLSKVSMLNSDDKSKETDHSYMNDDKSEEISRSFLGPDELVIWATPVYAGRIPNKTLDFVKSTLKGCGTMSIPVVVYGNRNYDNALAELTGIMKDNGLRPIAGAAIVARHAFNRADVNERPSKEDFDEIKEFCTYVADCIKNNHELEYFITAPGDEHPEKYYTPLKEDGTPAVFLKAKPKLHEELCVGCGVCQNVCPMGSIEFEHEDMLAGLTPEIQKNDSSGQNSLMFEVQGNSDGNVFEYNGSAEETRHPKFTGICIKCQACIRKCPSEALFFDDEEFLSHVRMLRRDYSIPQENSFIC